MSDLFSTARIVDYFAMFDMEVTKLNETSDKLQRMNQVEGREDFSPISCVYQHRQLKMYPKKNYKDKSLYELNIESIFQMLPIEYVYLRKPANKYFSLIFTNIDGNHYYGFFYKVFRELEKDHPIYSEVRDTQISIYSPQYLCFVSYHPYFISFKYILEELFNQSTSNDCKGIKVENILSILLFRMHMPKYETTQLCWTLNDKAFHFSKNIFRNEVSYRLLFSYISIEKVVLLYIASLMGSIIIFFHSNLEIVAPIIHLFMQLLYPFSAGFSIITNLNPKMKEYLTCPSSNIIIGLNTGDFDMAEVISLIRSSSANIVYCDIDENKLIIDNNEDMKNIELLPRQRINTLIDNLCKYGDFYEKDKNKFDLMKKKDIWDMFKSENQIGQEEHTSVKRNKSRESMLIRTPSANFNKGASRKTIVPGKENFSDEDIRALFFDFNLSLFEAYDESTQYEINNETHDVTFLTEKFVESSKPDIKNFLQYTTELPLFDVLLQNITHIVDMRYKNELKKTDPKFAKYDFKMNPSLREAALTPNFDKAYVIIKLGLERRKKSKSLNKLLRTRIYNTITIPSPKYEKLPYSQEDIFNDPMHEEVIFHEASVPLDKLNFDFTFLNLNLKEQNDFNKNLLKDEMIYLNKGDKAQEANKKKTAEKGNGNKEKNMLNLLKNITYEINTKNNPPTVQFKAHLQKNTELVKMYYGFILTKLKNLINRKNETNMIEAATNNNNNNININNVNPNVTAGSNNANNIMKTFSNFKVNAYSALAQKEDYIKSFNYFYNTYIKDKTNPMVEFHFNFCVNLVQSISFCEFCTKPNNIWDIRKEFTFNKIKKETKTKCKFCDKSYIPYFFVMEEEIEEKSSDAKSKKKKNNPSSEANNRLDSSVSDYQTDLISNKDTLDKTKKLKKVEYMSFDHILEAFYDYENEEKSVSKIKKFPYDLFYNICLLMGEIKIRINEKSKIEVFNFESYMNRHPNKSQVEVAEKEEMLDLSSKKNCNNNVMKMFKENYLKKKKEIEEQNVKKKTSTNFLKKAKDKISDKDKVVNIKFDLKDLMNEEKFREFEKDLKQLPQFNKNNLSKIKTLLRESKSTLGDNRMSSPFRFSSPSHTPATTTDIFPHVTKFAYTTNNCEANMRFSNPKSPSRSKSPCSKFSIDLIQKSKKRFHHSKSRSRSKKKRRSATKTRRVERVHEEENFILQDLMDEDEDMLKENLGVNSNSQKMKPFYQHANLKESFNQADSTGKKENELVDFNSYANKLNRGKQTFKKSSNKESNFLKNFDKLK